MKIATKSHIESLSVDALIEYTSQEFITYASSNGYKLGWIGGRYAVANNSGILYTNAQPHLALDTYIELLKII